MLRKTQHEVKVNSVTIKMATVTKEVEKNYKNVATQKLMLLHNKELKAKISIVTKKDYVATIKVTE